MKRVDVATVRTFNGEHVQIAPLDAPIRRALESAICSRCVWVLAFSCTAGIREHTPPDVHGRVWIKRCANFSECDEHGEPIL